MPVTYNEVQFATGSASNVGAATEIPLQLADSTHTVEILRVKLRQTAGTAASFAARIHSATGGTAGAISQEFAASSTLVADLCDVEAVGVLFRTDINGRAYLVPAPNAGSNNVFEFAVAFRVLA